MVSRHSSLSEAAKLGYARSPCNFPNGSPESLAYHAGTCLYDRGYITPERVVSVRGRVVRMETAASEFTIGFKPDFQSVESFTRH